MVNFYLFGKKHKHYEFRGGKVQEGETSEQAAVRETKKEIGCDVKLIKYLGYKDFDIDGKNFRSHKYLAKIKKGQKPKIMEQKLFRDIIWLPMKEYKKISCCSQC